MTQFIIRVSRHSYVLWGIFALTVSILVLAIEFQRVMITEGFEFVWSTTTGTLLVLALMYQWLLLFARQSGRAKSARFHYRAHRWVGVSAMVLFALHAVRFGYGWTHILTVVFLLCAASGLMNREVVRYRSQAAYNFWFWCHIALASALLPLIAVHVWVALAYQGAG